MTEVQEQQEEQNQERVAVIRTSDRSSFRQCRRKWNWNSHLRGNLGPIQNATPLWFGTGFHFVMEDYHGYRYFETPMKALDAYVNATLAFDRKMVPDDYQEAHEMGIKMLEYFLKWEERRKLSLIPTLWIDGVPQVEVNFRIPIPMDQELLQEYGYDRVEYSGTIDRVCIDNDTGLIWLLDYKTAKVFNTSHFINDSQVTSYCWAAQEMYKDVGSGVIGGMIYAQHLKKDITSARVLKNGTISTAKNQSITHILYKEKMEEIYGSVEASPQDNIDYLNDLAFTEDERKDKFIQYDYLHRSQQFMTSEGVKILMETRDMLNPKLPLYPAPSRDCQYMCSFLSPCVSLDDGSDWESELKDGYQTRPKDYDGWRKFIEWPEGTPHHKPKEEGKTTSDFKQVLDNI